MSHLLSCAIAYSQTWNSSTYCMASTICVTNLDTMLQKITQRVEVEFYNFSSRFTHTVREPCIHSWWALYIKGIAITTDSLFQIQMSEHNSLVCGVKLYDNLSSFSANFPPHYHTILAINCVHASNWFTHLQWTRQIDGQNDNSVLTVCRKFNSRWRELVLIVSRKAYSWWRE